MSQKEFDRTDIIKRLIRKEINGTETANMLKLSTRQVRRLKNRVRIRGVKALIHGNRGKPSNRRMPEICRKKIISILKKKYPDFKPGHACEKLEEFHKIKSNPETIRRIMIDEGLWKLKKKKRGSEHRKWRQRRSTYGEMQQFDGSYEYWFEDRAEKCCLLGSIDDATGRTTKLKFDTDEGVFPVFSFWKEYLEANGAPRAIYMDKFSTYSMNHKTAKENPETLTQFRRALEEFHIEPITAHSPQAKGRIERLFETLQDRLIKELRLRNISTMEEANKYLEKEFVPWFNKKYAVEPRSKANVHKKLLQREQKKLSSIFSRQTERTVNNDFTISFAKLWYQLTEKQPVTVCKKDKVIVEERLDGTIQIRLRGKHLAYDVLPERPKKVKDQPWVLAKTAGPKKPHKPGKNHPWRNSLILNPITEQNTKVGHF